MARRTLPMVVALFLINAFSAFPSAFYGRIAVATGTRWSTALLFSGHGVAAIAGMTLAALPAWAMRSARRPGWFVAAGLALDAAGGLLLAGAPDGALGTLLAGRLVCGLALGTVTFTASEFIMAGSAGSAGSTAITAAVFGGVGAGALFAGGASAVGLPQSGVLGLGAIIVVGAAVFVLAFRTDRVERGRSAGGGARTAPRTMSAPASVPGGGAWMPIAGAFACNGVLALFTSTMPAEVSRLAGGASLVAGVTAGSTMLAAGAVRLVLTPWLGARWIAPTTVAAVAGAVLLALGFVHGGAAGAITAVAGGMLLGASAGLGYEASIRRAAAGRSVLSAVQRAGQAGLVLPTIVATAVAR